MKAVIALSLLIAIIINILVAIDTKERSEIVNRCKTGDTLWIGTDSGIHKAVVLYKENGFIKVRQSSYLSKDTLVYIYTYDEFSKEVILE